MLQPCGHCKINDEWLVEMFLKSGVSPGGGGGGCLQYYFIFLRDPVAGLVQNTEVQLDCTHIRIGMLKGTPVGQVRVITDKASGIYFKLDSTSLARALPAYISSNYANTGRCY